MGASTAIQALPLRTAQQYRLYRNRASSPTGVVLFIGFYQQTRPCQSAVNKQREETVLRPVIATEHVDNTRPCPTNYPFLSFYEYNSTPCKDRNISPTNIAGSLCFSAAVAPLWTILCQYYSKLSKFAPTQKSISSNVPLVL